MKRLRSLLGQEFLKAANDLVGGAVLADLSCCHIGDRWLAASDVIGDGLLRHASS